MLKWLQLTLIELETGVEVGLITKTGELRITRSNDKNLKQYKVYLQTFQL